MVHTSLRTTKSKKPTKITKKSKSKVQVQLLESGNPVVKGLKNNHQDVALAYDDRLCLGVAGTGSQGCEMISVESRERNDWLALLGNSRQPLLDQVISQGSEALDLAGTRIFAVLETLEKLTELDAIELVLDKQDRDSIIFRAIIPEKDLYVLTFPLTLTRGKPRIVALIVSQPEAKKISPIKNYPEYPSDTYCLDTVIDNNNNFFYVRWPVSYRQVANFSQTVYFSNFFSWIEQVRDLALLPIRQTLGEQLATGKWGMVTNLAEVEILGEAGLDDVIESRIGIGNVSASQNSTVDFNYDWLKVLPNGDKERIAVGKLRMTWVKLTKNAPPQPLPLPEFIQGFINQIANYQPESLPDSFQNIPKGEKLYQNISRPNSSLLLQEQIFSTCLEETDAIGNINFQNYYIFQGRLRDGFFQEIIPEYYRRDLKQGEFRCLHSKVDFLREAFPFDHIKVKMYLQAVYERSVSLVFEYFRVIPNGTQEKLAVGQQDAIWLVPNHQGKSVSAAMPSKVKITLLKKVQ